MRPVARAGAKALACLLIAGRAHAGAPVPQPWDDGLTQTAPLRADVRLAHHMVLDTRFLHFFDLDVGLPLYASGPRLPSEAHPRRRRPSWSFGLRMTMSNTAASVPSEQRGTALVRNLGIGGWFSFLGPEQRSHHALVLSAGGSPSQGRTHWLSPLENTRWFTLVGYRGYLDLRPVDLVVGANVTLDATPVFRLTLTATVIAELHPLVALTAGARYTPNEGRAVFDVGLRARPTPLLELGFDLASSGWPRDSAPQRLVVWPSLEVRVRDGRSTGASTLW